MANKQPEEILCKAFIKTVNSISPLGINNPELFKIIHIANEQPRSTGTEKLANIIRGKKLKDVGKLAGVYDYMVLYYDAVKGCSRVAFLEAKAGKNSLSPKQKEFKAFLDLADIYNGVFKTVEEGIDILDYWGVLK